MTNDPTAGDLDPVTLARLADMPPPDDNQITAAAAVITTIHAHARARRLRDALTEPTTSREMS